MICTGTVSQAPDQPHRVVEEQNQPEGRQHLIEMVAAVEMS